MAQFKIDFDFYVILFMFYKYVAAISWVCTMYVHAFCMRYQIHTII